MDTSLLWAAFPGVPLRTDIVKEEAEWERFLPF